MDLAAADVHFGHSRRRAAILQPTKAERAYAGLAHERGVNHKRTAIASLHRQPDRSAVPAVVCDMQRQPRSSAQRLANCPAMVIAKQSRRRWRKMNRIAASFER